MALQVNINSFISVVQADNYFDDRLNKATWDNAINKDEALVTATGILNTLNWSGTSTSFTNVGGFKLAWPRSITFADPISGVNEVLTDNRTSTDGGTIPQDIKDATCEMAYHLILNTDLLDNTSTVSDLTVGSIRLLGSQKAPTLPDQVIRLISKYLAGGANFRGVFAGSAGL